MPFRCVGCFCVGLPYHRAMIEQDVIDLHRRVAKLERMVAFLMKHGNVTFVDERTDVPAEVVAMVRARDKLGALKRYRELTGADILQAKAVIDTIE